MAKIPEDPSFLYERAVVLSFDLLKKNMLYQHKDTLNSGVTAITYPWDLSVSDSLSCNAGWKV